MASLRRSSAVPALLLGLTIFFASALFTVAHAERQNVFLAETQKTKTQSKASDTGNGETETSKAEIAFAAEFLQNTDEFRRLKGAYPKKKWFELVDLSPLQKLRDDDRQYLKDLLRVYPPAHFVIVDSRMIVESRDRDYRPTDITIDFRRFLHNEIYVNDVMVKYDPRASFKENAELYFQPAWDDYQKREALKSSLFNFFIPQAFAFTGCSQQDQGGAKASFATAYAYGSLAADCFTAATNPAGLAVGACIGVGCAAYDSIKNKAPFWKGVADHAPIVGPIRQLMQKRCAAPTVSETPKATSGKH